MREIKFRGKRLDDGEWVYGSYIPPTEANHRAHIYALDVENFIEVDPKTVGQYTGLKDKNGVEIYEGDIVRVTDVWGGNTKHQIKYLIDSNYPAFDLVPWLEVETNGLTYCMGSDAEIEIIGNIYENPELLK